MRKTFLPPVRMTLALWTLACVAVLVASVCSAWPRSAGEPVAALMFLLTLPVSPATGWWLDSVGFSAWLPRAEPWHAIAIWAAFFVPGLAQWLLVRRLWRALSPR